MSIGLVFNLNIDASCLWQEYLERYLSVMTDCLTFLRENGIDYLLAAYPDQMQVIKQVHKPLEREIEKANTMTLPWGHVLYGKLGELNSGIFKDVEIRKGKVNITYLPEFSVSNGMRDRLVGMRIPMLKRFLPNGYQESGYTTKDGISFIPCSFLKETSLHGVLSGTESINKMIKEVKLLDGSIIFEDLETFALNLGAPNNFIAVFREFKKNGIEFSGIDAFEGKKIPETSLMDVPNRDYGKWMLLPEQKRLLERHENLFAGWEHMDGRTRKLALLSARSDVYACLRERVPKNGIGFDKKGVMRNFGVKASTDTWQMNTKRIKNGKMWLLTDKKRWKESLKLMNCIKDNVTKGIDKLIDVRL
jgi:hypothetical protein